MHNIFVKEDIAKPENRVNLAIFHLQMISEFHNWFCCKLHISKDSVIFPTENLNGDRPDFIIKEGDHIHGYIEVELGGENISQLSSYRYKYETEKSRIFSITGKIAQGSDLGLDEINSYLLSIYDFLPNNQARISATYLMQLITTYTNGSISYSRNPVSEKMLKNPFVNDLLNALKDYIPAANQKRAEPGKYYCDTNSPKGFSFRVFTPYSSQKSLSLLSITNSSDYITFLSAEKYRHYLAHKSGPDIDSWIIFITKRLGLPIDKKEFDGRSNLSISSVNNYFDEMVNCIKALI
jgi:hypothetical protein